MSATAGVAIPAATAIIIQGLQAWMAMARMAGMSAEQLEQLYKAELAKFQQNTPDKLPDPV
jgi:hypothetical protein